MNKALPKHKTKIVCTIGPASRKKQVLKGLILAGMNVARLNFSHGNLDQHARDIDAIRQVSRMLGRDVAILGDLPGPKIRIGQLESGSCTLKRGDRVVLTTRRVKGTSSLIPVQFEDFPRSVEPGGRIFLNDGFIELKVLEKKGRDVLCRVVIGGSLLSNKGMNLPDAHLTMSAATSEDLRFITFGLEHGIDMFGLSFVRSPRDIRRVREFASKKGSDIFVVAKIERGEAVRGSEAIIDAADAVMVARGDLGVEVAIEDVPLIQKQLILQANLAAKPVITATQMLESMTDNTRPTRAEVTDAANAVFDGTDAVMLSEETAIGKYPVRACTMLAKIAAAAEAGRYRAVSGTVVPETIRRFIESSGSSIKETLSLNVGRAITSLGIRCVAVSSRSGLTARMISRLKSDAWIIALCRNESVLKGLSLSSGVHPVILDGASSDGDIIAYLRSRGFVRKNEAFILVRRSPCDDLGTENTMKIIDPSPYGQ
ncbi:MAG TPA: pyruvate kinase [Deltaproteobacteria bacterium]|jgi:pyruvate kinase|nr:pyruvate kinase [Deltaproteobacteria bacterium]MDI9541503.1 pyruvate kinase [Pseudomonadota bacterium]HRR20519.1 pyruvate kinase [Desulfomonilia bacterium]HOE71527.1 pyruvate kinase [Deltaproteobacteria bacterium]HOS26016.1 pyruvate kinase [Deltaproteobacteria bacterium]